jgi:4-hydroxybenzoate polyprenyltransferase
MVIDNPMEPRRPVSALPDWWQLARGGNSLLAGAAAAVGAYLATGRWEVAVLVRAAIPPILATAAGNIDNDRCDRDIDRQIKPDRPLAARRISLSAASIAVAILAVAAFLVALSSGETAAAVVAGSVVLLALYNRRGAAIPAVGNLMVAFLGALPVIYGAIAVAPGTPAQWLIAGLGAAVAFWLHLARELLKDAIDLEGDLFGRRRTLAVVLGARATIRIAAAVMLLAAATALVIGLGDWLGVLYLFGVIVTIIPALLLGAAQCAFDPDPLMAERWSFALKLCMVTGLAWLVLGRGTW